MRPRAHTTPIGNDETMAVSRRYNSKIAHQTSTPNDKKKIPAQLHFRLILSYFFFDSCFVTRYHLLCRRLFFNHYLNYKYSRFLQRFFFVWFFLLAVAYFSNAMRRVERVTLSAFPRCVYIHSGICLLSV